MMLKVNFNSPVPLYEQIKNEIEDMIKQGKLQPGDSLPSIRSLASQLDIAVNTVARAYMELENEHLIESGGRRGSFVRRDLQIDGGDDNSTVFKKQVLKLIQQGLSKQEIERIFNETIKNFFD